MSLDEKIEQSKQSEATDINSWLGSLSQSQMQALWKRFQYAQDAIKDDDVGKAWDQACTGPGSSKTETDLLVTYLRSDTDRPLSKKGSLWYKRLIEHTKTTGSRKTTVWEPFQAMKTSMRSRS